MEIFTFQIRQMEQRLQEISTMGKCLATLWARVRMRPDMSKILILLDEKFRVVKFLLSAGNVNDNLLALPLLKGLTLKGKAVLADKAYSTAKIRGFPIKSMPR